MSCECYVQDNIGYHNKDVLLDDRGHILYYRLTQAQSSAILETSANLRQDPGPELEPVLELGPSLEPPAHPSRRPLAPK